MDGITPGNGGTGGNTPFFAKAVGRLTTLDFLKGLGLIFILYSHLSIYVGNESWKSFHMFQLIIYRPIGPANYTICSILGVVLSLDRREIAKRTSGRGGGDAMVARAFRRMVALVIFGSLINVGLIWHELVNPDVSLINKVLKVIFTWNIITSIGFSQFIAFFFKRLSVLWQIISIAAVFAFYYIMVPVIIDTFVNMGLPYQSQDLTTNQGMNAILFVYHYLFFHNSMAPFIPCIAFTLLTCVVFRNVSRLMASNKEAARLLIKGEFKKIYAICTGLIVTAMIVGGGLGKGVINRNEYYQLIHDDPFRIWNPSSGGYPIFLQPNNPMHVLFSFGIMSIITITMLWFIDIDKNERVGKRKWMNSLSTMGKYTLTLFITHGIFSLAPNILDFFTFIFTFLGITTAYIVGFHYWEKFNEGKYSLEWMVKKFIH
ncbi:MAG: hypothetical protein ACTSUE_24390 [Promethearchaeota archaeon]